MEELILTNNTNMEKAILTIASVFKVEVKGKIAGQPSSKQLTF